MLGSLDDTLKMSAEIESVEPCLDFPHLHARTGDGTMNSLQEWEGVLEKIEEYLGSAALSKLHIHLSGIKYGEKGEEKHLPITESDLDLRAILQALHKNKCSGRILCESPIMEEDALYIKENWQEISGED